MERKEKSKTATTTATAEEKIVYKISKTIGQIADFVSGSVKGNPDELIFRPSEIQRAKKGDISFLVSDKYEKYLESCEATCLVVSQDFFERRKQILSKIRVENFIQVENPLLAMLKILSLWEYSLSFPENARHLAYVSPKAYVHQSALIFPFSYIGADAQVGEKSVVMPGVFIGDGAKIGSGVFMFPNSVVYPFCEIGDNSIVHSGAVIGADGFGFVSYFGDILKIPQVGIAKVGKNVEIGANTCIDRATMNITEVGDDVKIDNLVQIAHNVYVGRGTRIAAMTGIAGSSKVGEFCVFGGQVGVVDHVEIGDYTILGARAVVISDIEGGKVYMGEPAMERIKFLKVHSLYTKLPEIYERLKKLEEEVFGKKKSE
ncbi:MAG: UDP-3-O-(3-hydroxymyristoyl)glucosamine N-acyltransferase [Candidatus Calescibacterium sp.]|nr:UDP-3-O-(3-hydroxymyristoyl)glucosamine N-acyltransferase [Candidatus Calescibacterium sp.]MCX7733152.1 UDP-3-O-(3-hydroxymyristoyl)glucosamine N-acyltransferase [bacterium]MDW8087708.1 UDP-3-O-(3-hydroxymyristoyl)glucosamine N-acyltransferase [Candidatus Calescibacterium sp.]